MIVEIATDANGPYFKIIGAQPQISVRVEFLPRKKIGLKSDCLARAIGYKKGEVLRVIDATAGLCRDAFHIACLGCQVVAIENNLQIFNVVSYFVNLLPTKYNLTLVHQEAKKFLLSLSENDRPDVIYLDPMFPEKNKSAKPGKESELLKLLAPIASIEEEKNFLNSALQVAKKRVVIKRPLYAPAIKSSPQIVFKGKSVRYDVYITGSKHKVSHMPQ
ncbi:MAG: hypothetical protein A2Z20_08360 [Bdellovibrionales bacterium RBG_16_40_8]|nr:MAG: hypothetical protein A2Z20_08360 [Bdellovibrionales bacterium RBG_16_40_8]